MTTILSAMKKNQPKVKSDKNEIPRLKSNFKEKKTNKKPKIRRLIWLLIGVILLFFLGRLGQSIFTKLSETYPVVNDTVNSEIPAKKLSTYKVQAIVYTEETKKRLVMISGRVFREGESIDANVKVQKIDKNKVYFLSNNGESWIYVQ